MYHFYLEGCSKPVWSYKTWHWARKRLNRFVSERSLKHLRIESISLGKVREIGYVSFSEFGWFIEWKKVSA